MRRVISLIIASSLAAIGGAGVLYLLLFAAGWKGWMVLGAGGVFAAGVMWLYDDLSNPSSGQGH
jgi:hypothetical protein